MSALCLQSCPTRAAQRKLLAAQVLMGLSDDYLGTILKEGSQAIEREPWHLVQNMHDRHFATQHTTLMRVTCRAISIDLSNVARAVRA